MTGRIERESLSHGGSPTEKAERFQWYFPAPCVVFWALRNALRGLSGSLADGCNGPAIALVVARAACRSKTFPDGAERDHAGGARLVRRAGVCRGRDRDPAGLTRQRGPSACAAHRTDRRRRRADDALFANLAGVRRQKTARRR